MELFQIVLLFLTTISLLLPLISYRYFSQLMKLIKIRIGTFLVAGSMIILVGYIFFLLPWLVVGNDIIVIRTLSYYIIMAGLFILIYSVIKVYIDWRDLIR